jgi:hypothetical protein
MAAIALVLWRRNTNRIEPTGAAALGVASAPVVLIYYTDYQCAGCRAFATQTLPELRTRFVDAGALRIVVKDLDTSPESAAIANAARCAAEFGKYWPFHDSVVVVTGAALSRGTFQRIAANIGVPADPFDRCLTRRRHTREVQGETARARRLGVEMLPAFALGGRNRRMWPRVIGRGVSAEMLDTMIDRELRR